jgi:hypothetical protein
LFQARLEAIDVILEDANPHEVLMVCVHALAAAAPGCCEDIWPSSRRSCCGTLRECMAQQQEAEDAADEEPAPSLVH